VATHQGKQGNGKVYYSRPSPPLYHQQVSEYSKINAVMYKSSVPRKKNRKPSKEEKVRRQQQQAKDRAASAAAVVAAKQLLKEKAALDAEKRKAHRQAQISKSKVEKEKKSAIAKDARSKTYAEAAQTSPPCASPAVTSTTSAPTSSFPGKVSSICAVQATSSPSAPASASAQSSPASSSLGKAAVPVQLASMTEAGSSQNGPVHLFESYPFATRRERCRKDREAPHCSSRRIIWWASLLTLLYREAQCFFMGGS
jgi:hypothetical protein